MYGATQVLVVAFASLLGNIDLRYKRRYLKIWGGGVKLSNLLNRYGVSHELKTYTTTVKGKKYTRHVIIIKNWELVQRAKQILETDTKTKWYIARYRRIFRRVAKTMKRSRGWKKLEKILGENGMKMILGIKPYVSHVYQWFRKKKITQELKPNWRFMLYLRRLYGENPVLADRVKERYLYRRYRW